jgi:hypothetical protein
MKKTIIIGTIILFSISIGYAQKEKNAFVYDSKGKRDPFLSLVSPEGYLVNVEPFAEVSEINVEGIIYDPKGSSFAIINSEIVKVGEKIGDFEVLDIKKNKVILLKDAEKFEIDLKEGR